MKTWIPEAFSELSYPLARYHVHQRNSNDCGPYCVAMVTNTLYAGPFVNAAALAEELNRRGFPERIPGWATLPWGVVASLRRLGLRARWRLGASLKQLFTNLRQDCITIVIVGEPLYFEGRTWLCPFARNKIAQRIMSRKHSRKRVGKWLQETATRPKCVVATRIRVRPDGPRTGLLR